MHVHMQLENGLFLLSLLVAAGTSRTTQTRQDAARSFRPKTHLYFSDLKGPTVCVFITQGAFKLE